MNFAHEKKQAETLIKQACGNIQQEWAYAQGGHDTLQTLHAQLKDALTPDVFAEIEHIFTATADTIDGYIEETEKRAALFKKARQAMKFADLMMCPGNAIAKTDNCGDKS